MINLPCPKGDRFVVNMRFINTGIQNKQMPVKYIMVNRLVYVNVNYK